MRIVNNGKTCLDCEYCTEKGKISAMCTKKGYSIYPSNKLYMSCQYAEANKKLLEHFKKYMED